MDGQQGKAVPVWSEQQRARQAGRPAAASWKTTLQFPVQAGSSGRGSQRQRTSAAKETLSLGAVFYFYLLSQHRLYIFKPI